MKKISKTHVLYQIMLSDFEWSDILLGHYLLSLFIGLIVVIVTYIVSKTCSLHVNIRKTVPNINTISEKDIDDRHSTTTTPVMKKSPALAAEKVIKENMTKEQQLLEYQIRQKQLAQIHEIMLKQSDKFGNISMSDVEEQMKLYQ